MHYNANATDYAFLDAHNHYVPQVKHAENIFLNITIFDKSTLVCVIFDYCI